MGFATNRGKTMTQIRLAIPNQVIRELYCQYFKLDFEQHKQMQPVYYPVSTLETLIRKGFSKYRGICCFPHWLSCLSSVRG